MAFLDMVGWFWKSHMPVWLFVSAGSAVLIGIAHQAAISIKLVARPAGDLLTIDADVCRH